MDPRVLTLITCPPTPQASLLGWLKECLKSPNVLAPFHPEGPKD